MRLKPAASEFIGDAQFRALVLSQAIFDLGIFMRGTANSWVVLELTGSQLWIGLVAGVRTIPIMGFAFAGGAIADRFARRTLMIAGGFLIASASAIVAVLFQSNTIEPWHLVVMSIASGVGGAIYGPAFYSLIADIVRSDRLSNANGLLSVAQTTGEMLGPMIVGLVIAASGAPTVFWLVVAGNAAGLLLLIRVREPERKTEKSKASFKSQLLEGLSYAKNTPPLLWLTLLLIGQNLFAVAIFPLMPVYAEDVLEIGPTGFGLMGGFFGAGMLIGAVFVSMYGVHNRHAIVMLLMGLVWDVSMVIFAFSDSVALSMSCLFAMGLISIPWITAMMIMFQNAATDEMRGRVMSLYVIGMNTFPLGWLFGGAVAETLGNEEALVISALLGTPVAAIAIASSRSLRHA